MSLEHWLPRACPRICAEGEDEDEKAVGGRNWERLFISPCAAGSCRSWPMIWSAGEEAELAAGERVRSSVTVGKGAEAERVAKPGEQGRAVRARKLGFRRPWWSALGMEPERSIEAAAEVVDAIAMAAGGRGWLWWPSRMTMNSLGHPIFL